MANNIANKLIVNAKTQAEIKSFLSAIAGIERGETLDVDFEKIAPTPECVSKDWYDWRISNWGTKWNAYETEIDSCSDGSVEIYFCTANDGAIPIIKKLVEKYPHLEFIYKYADYFPEDESDEAMALYIDCWQQEWDNFKKTEDGWVWKD